VDDKGMEQEMCVPAESSGTSPTFKVCCLYKKRRKRSAATMDNISRHVILRTQSPQKHNGQQSHIVFQNVINTEISKPLSTACKKKRRYGSS
jgi:hypothetical protein